MLCSITESLKALFFLSKTQGRKKSKGLSCLKFQNLFNEVIKSVVW